MGTCPVGTVDRGTLTGGLVPWQRHPTPSDRHSGSHRGLPRSCKIPPPVINGPPRVRHSRGHHGVSTHRPVQLPLRIGITLEYLQDSLPHARSSPATEPAVNSAPRTEMGWQIPPTGYPSCSSSPGTLRGMCCVAEGWSCRTLWDRAPTVPLPPSTGGCAHAGSRERGGRRQWRPVLRPPATPAPAGSARPPAPGAPPPRSQPPPRRIG